MHFAAHSSPPTLNRVSEAPSCRGPAVLAPNPGLQEIALACGVTKMTVSRALRGLPGVSDKTRRAIRAEAERVGYTPDPIISKLISRLRNSKRVSERETIALLWPDALPNQIASPIFATIRRSFRLQAAKSGFRINDFHCDEPGLTGRRLAQILKARGIQVLCIAPTSSGTAQNILRNFPFADFVCAVMGAAPEIPPLPCAQFHHWANLQRVIDELLRLGFRRPALSLSLFTPAQTRRLLAGTFAQQHPESAAADRLLLLPGPHPTPLEEWLRLQRPDVLICDSPEPPAAARSTLGTGLAFVTLNRVSSSGLHPGLDPRYDLLAANAAELAISQFLRPERGPPARPITVLHEGDWHAADLAPPRSGATPTEISSPFPSPKGALRVWPTVPGPHSKFVLRTSHRIGPGQRPHSATAACPTDIAAPLQR